MSAVTEFNTAALLKQINRTGAVEMAVAIDEAMAAVTDYQMHHNHMNGPKAADMLTCLRGLRNALLEGANSVRF